LRESHERQDQHHIELMHVRTRQVVREIQEVRNLMLRPVIVSWEIVLAGVGAVHAHHSEFMGVKGGRGKNRWEATTKCTNPIRCDAEIDGWQND
jgi:hypothetical protein